MGLVTFASRPITMVFSIFLLRLLDPEDFGTVALAMIIFNTANLFTDLGMRPAVVQSKDNIDQVAYIAFLVVNITSLLFYAGVFIFAEPIAVLLGGDASLVPIMRLLGLIVVIDAWWIIPEALLKRDLMFKRLAVTQVPGEIASGVVAIILAFLGYGVYALVYGALVSELVRAVIVWYLLPTYSWLKPKRIDWEIAGHLLRFGAPAMGSGIARYFSQHWDDWVVGRQLGTAALGFYSKAYDMTSRITFMFSNVLFGNVLMPSYAKVQDDPKRLERGYLKSTSLVLLTMVPMSLGLLVLAHTIVLVLFGEKWLPMVVSWQIFSLYALTRPISANSSPLFMAVGKPGYNLQAVVVILVVMVPLLFLLIGPYGIAGVAVAVSVAHLVSMLYNVFQVNRILPGTAVKTLRVNLPFLFAGGIMAVAVQLSKGPVFSIAGGENWISLTILVAIGALVYLSLVFLLQRALIVEILTLVVAALDLERRAPRLVPQRLRAVEKPGPGSPAEPTSPPVP